MPAGKHSSRGAITSRITIFRLLISIVLLYFTTSDANLMAAGAQCGDPTPLLLALKQKAAGEQERLEQVVTRTALIDNKNKNEDAPNVDSPREQLAEAVREFVRVERALTLWPIAMSAATDKQWTTAAKSIQSIRLLFPDLSSVHCEFARVMQELGLIDSAASALIMAISVSTNDPHSVGLRTRLASLLHELGDCEGAMAQARHILTQQPESALAHLVLANCLDKSDTSIELPPVTSFQLRPIKLTLASDTAIINSEEEAEQQQQQQEQQHEWTNSSSSSLDEILFHLQQAVRLGHGDNISVHARIGAILAKRKDFHLASMHLLQAVEQFPESAALHYELGAVLHSRVRTLLAVRPEGSQDVTEVCRQATFHLQHATWLDSSMRSAKIELVKVLWLRDLVNDAMPVVFELMRDAYAVKGVSQMLVSQSAIAAASETKTDSPGKTATPQVSTASLVASDPELLMLFAHAYGQLKQWNAADDALARVLVFTNATTGESLSSRTDIEPHLLRLVQIRAQVLLGNTRAQRGLVRPALDAWEVAFNMGWDSLDTRLQAARMYWESALPVDGYENVNEGGSVDAALRHLRQAIMRWPRAHDAHQLMGDVLLYENNSRDALHCFRLAALLQPTCMKCHLGTGLAFLQLNKPHRALDRFRIVLKSIEDVKTDSDQQQVLFNTAPSMEEGEGKASQQQRNSRLSSSFISETTLSLHRHNLGGEVDPAQIASHARAGLGDALMQIGQFEAALQQYYKVLDGVRDNDHSTLLNNVAVAQFSLGNTKQALRWLKAAVGLDANNEDAQRNLAHLTGTPMPDSSTTFGRGDVKQNRSAFVGACDEPVSQAWSAASVVDLGDILHQQGDTQASMRCFAAVVESNYTMATVHVMKGNEFGINGFMHSATHSRTQALVAVAKAQLATLLEEQLHLGPALDHALMAAELLHGVRGHEQLHLRSLLAATRLSATQSTAAQLALSATKRHPHSSEANFLLAKLTPPSLDNAPVLQGAINSAIQFLRHGEHDSDLIHAALEFFSLGLARSTGDLKNARISCERATSLLTSQEHRQQHQPEPQNSQQQWSQRAKEDLPAISHVRSVPYRSLPSSSSSASSSSLPVSGWSWATSLNSYSFATALTSSSLARTDNPNMHATKTNTRPHTKAFYERMLGHYYPSFDNLRVNVFTACGDVFWESGQGQRAAAAYIEAVRFSSVGKPGLATSRDQTSASPRAHWRLARLLRSDGQLSAALVLLETAVAWSTESGVNSPANSNTYSGDEENSLSVALAARADLAELREQVGQFALAIEDYLVLARSTFSRPLVRARAMERAIVLLRSLGHAHEAQSRISALSNMLQSHNSAYNEPNVQNAESLSLALFREQVMWDEAIGSLSPELYESGTDTDDGGVDLARTLAPDTCKWRFQAYWAGLLDTTSQSQSVEELLIAFEEISVVVGAQRLVDNTGISLSLVAASVAVHPRLLLAIEAADKREGVETNMSTDFRILSALKRVLGMFLLDPWTPAPQVLGLINLQAMAMANPSAESENESTDDEQFTVLSFEHLQGQAEPALSKSLGTDSSGTARLYAIAARIHSRLGSWYTALLYARAWMLRARSQPDAHAAVASALTSIARFGNQTAVTADFASLAKERWQRTAMLYSAEGRDQEAASAYCRMGFVALELLEQQQGREEVENFVAPAVTAHLAFSEALRVGHKSGVSCATAGLVLLKAQRVTDAGVDLHDDTINDPHGRHDEDMDEFDLYGEDDEDDEDGDDNEIKVVTKQNTVVGGGSDSSDADAGARLLDILLGLLGHSSEKDTSNDSNTLTDALTHVGSTSLTKIADLCVHYGKHSGALWAYETALSRVNREGGHSVGYARLLIDLGNARVKLGQLSAGEEAYRNAAALDSSLHRTALHNLAVVATMHAQPHRAIATFKQLIAISTLNPGDERNSNSAQREQDIRRVWALARTNLAEVYLEQKQPRAAALHLRELLTSSAAPSDPAALARLWRALALSLHQMGQHAQAVRGLQRARDSLSVLAGTSILSVDAEREQKAILEDLCAVLAVVVNMKPILSRLLSSSESQSAGERRSAGNEVDGMLPEADKMLVSAGTELFLLEEGVEVRAGVRRALRASPQWWWDSHAEWGLARKVPGALLKAIRRGLVNDPWLNEQVQTRSPHNYGMQPHARAALQLARASGDSV